MRDVEADPRWVEVAPALVAAQLRAALSVPVELAQGPIGTGLTPGLQLVVEDIQAARAELVARGVEVSAVQHIEEGVWVDGPGGPASAWRRSWR